MAARLGQVFYWAGCVVAAVILLLGLPTIFNPDGPGFPILSALVVAFVIWLIGRACLYVLAGR